VTSILPKENNDRNLMSDLKSAVNFDIIRYANCWEDADILLAGLKPEPGDRIISIASAGDNTFSLLINNPESVIAVDISKVQLYLIELKKVCFQVLSYEQTLSFLGYTPSSQRQKIYDKVLRPHLSSEAAKYWDKNKEMISEGVIHCGKFERYFAILRNRLMPWIHSRRTIQKLFEPKSAEEQEKFYYKTWCNWRWKLVFSIFFSRFVLGRLGRDPRLLQEVKINVHRFIFGQAERHLKSTAVQHNYFLKFIFTGEFAEQLPHYLRAENYERIRGNLHKLKLHNGLLEEVLDKEPYNLLNLSNIFEYLDADTVKTIAEKITATISQNGRLCYWNLMVPRQLSVYNNSLEYLEELSEQLHNDDKCFFYSKFIVEKVL
jgi:S-adenosylmethionine-diacylglycerol 3-amino-3-carboxypropyl transferase